MIERRLSRIASALKRGEAAFTESPSTIFYLTGIRAEGSLVVKSSKAKLFLSSLYPFRKAWVDDIRNLVSFLPEKIFVEPQGFSWGRFLELKKKGKTVYNGEKLFSRQSKEQSEIKKIASAQRISRKIFNSLSFKKGVKEKDVAARIMAKSFSLADGFAFEPIVAFGKNSFYPHHIPGDTVFSDDFALVDLGVKVGNYASDLTQMEGFPKIKGVLRKAASLVQMIFEDAYSSIRSGIKIGEYVRKVLTLVEEKGFLKNMFHSLGHGVGIDVHEKPFIRKNSSEIFTDGMVFALEPAFYFRGFGGIRLENVYVLQGSRLLNVEEM